MTELKNMTLSAEEIELIRVFRQCDSDRREYVLYFLRKFCEIGWDGAAHMIQGAMNAKDSFEREKKIKKAISYGRKVPHTYNGSKIQAQFGNLTIISGEKKE